MKRLGKCLVAIALAACVTFPTVGCVRREGGEVVVPDTMTGLYVGNYDGGLGHEWLEKAIAIFEERNKDVSFEPGKVGVKVVPKNDKEPYTGSTLMNAMSTNTEDVYITGTISYADFVTAGVLADVTDVMTAKEPGQKSIAERMNPSMHRTFNVGTTEEQYFGAPSMSAISGIVYDVDLFESEKLYIAAGSTGTNIQWTNATNKSVGMDNEPGTYDDGLPETWEQLKALMTRMVTRNIIPFTWGGMYNTYVERFLNCVWASYEGVDDYLLNYTFDGVDSDVGPINKSNGYLLQKQSGKLAALTVAEHIMSDSRYYYSQSPAQSHTDAQAVYLSSVEDTKGQIAMLLEGNWWENEARGTFDNMVKYNENYAYGVRRFAYMPFPKFVGTAGVPDAVAPQNAILCDAGSGCVIVSKYTEKPELAKKFYAFLLSEEIQALMTATTGVVMPFEYKLSEAQYNGMTYYAKSIWDLMHDENSALVYPVLDEPIRVENTTYFADWNWVKDVTVNNRRLSARDPMHAFYQYGNTGLTAKAYFDGLSAKFTQTSWNTTLGKYFQ